MATADTSTAVTVPPSVATRGMDFLEIVDQVVNLLCRRSRLTYQRLKLQFNLDDMNRFYYAISYNVLAVISTTHLPSWSAGD